jgi:hypothetical protein
MEKARPIYSAVDKEVSKLLTYFRSTITKEFGNDTMDFERLLRIFILTMARIQIVGCSNTRLYLKDLEITMRSVLKKERARTYCNRCKKTVSVNIIGEERMGPLNLMFDKVVCKVCGNEFYSSLPNNKDDQYKMADELIKRIPLRIKKEQKKPDSKALIEVAKQQLKTAKKLKNSITQYRNLYEMQTGFLLEYERRINVIHDFLLKAKKHGMWWPDFSPLVIGLDYPNIDFDQLTQLENASVLGL